MSKIGENWQNQAFDRFNTRKVCLPAEVISTLNFFSTEQIDVPCSLFTLMPSDRHYLCLNCAFSLTLFHLCFFLIFKTMNISKFFLVKKSFILTEKSDLLAFYCCVFLVIIYLN